MHPATFREGYAIRDQEAPHFLTLTICGWIDLFTRKNYRDIVIESMKYCQQYKGLQLHAYVIMSNHIHAIISASVENKLSDIIRDFKKFTCKKFLEVIQSSAESRRLWMVHQFAYYGSRHAKQQDFQIWTNDNHPEAIYTMEFMLAKVNYIHENPVRAGLVAAPEHYLYSSASNYLNGTGMVDVLLLY